MFPKLPLIPKIPLPVAINSLLVLFVGEILVVSVVRLVEFEHFSYFEPSPEGLDLDYELFVCLEDFHAVVEQGFCTLTAEIMLFLPLFEFIDSVAVVAGVRLLFCPYKA